MLRRTFVATLLALATAPALAQSPPPVTVVEPWARATPAGTKVGAAYLELKAAPGTDDKLLSASSPVAGTVEIHNHIMDNGIARMRRVDAVPVPAGGSVALKPGGYHVMLMNLNGQLKAGDKFKLKLTFEKSPPVEVDVEVRPIGAKAAPDHGH